MGDKTDIWQATLALMGHKNAEDTGPLHGYGVVRRSEQTSGALPSDDDGTLYPALLRLKQKGYASSERGVSERNRQAKPYKLTHDGRKQLAKGAREWGQTTIPPARHCTPAKES